MKKCLLSISALLCVIGLMAATINVTPDTYVDAFAGATNGDVLMLSEGTYATALSFPDSKTITLQKSASAASAPILTFSWTFPTVPTTGSGLKLIGLEINPNADYYIYPTVNGEVSTLEFKDCTISNVHRCLVRASNDPTIVRNLTLENCYLKDCGSKGYSLVWLKGIMDNYSFKNCTVSNYQGEGFFLASTTQTNTFKFDMQNNTIYLSGKDGAYSWCTINTFYDASCTYNISNNIFYKPFTTADTRKTIIVPADGGKVTCKNNLFIDFPNSLVAPAAGWDTTNMWVSSTNYFKDVANGDFTLTSNFPFKGIDNNLLGAKRWWPSGGSAINELNAQNVKISVQHGRIQFTSGEPIGSVSIFDMKGNRLLMKQYKSNTASMETNCLNKGIYVLNIHNGNKNTVQRISIQH